MRVLIEACCRIINCIHASLPQVAVQDIRKSRQYFSPLEKSIITELVRKHNYFGKQKERLQNDLTTKKQSVGRLSQKNLIPSQVYLKEMLGN